MHAPACEHGNVRLEIYTGHFGHEGLTELMDYLSLPCSVPSMASQRPLMTRKRELFPKPFSPIIRMFCPAFNLKDTSAEVQMGFHAAGEDRYQRKKMWKRRQRWGKNLRRKER